MSVSVSPEKHRGFAFIEFEMAEVSVRDWEGEILHCVEKAAAPI